MRALRDDGMAVSEPSETPNVRLAVLISGTGRTLANLIESIAAEALEAEVVAVVSSRAGVRGIEIAEVAGIRRISRYAKTVFGRCLVQ